MMGLRHPPMPIFIERVSDKLRFFYRDVREPPAPRRPRLGLSERQEMEAREELRPPRKLLVSRSRHKGDWYDRRIDERLAEKKWLELPRKH